MSNQFSLMLSMLFLATLIIFSGELINYQKEYAIFNSDMNQIAHHLQVYGYDIYYLCEVDTKYNLNSVRCKNEETDQGEIYYLSCSKKYQSFTNMFSFMNKDFVCNIPIYR